MAEKTGGQIVNLDYTEEELEPRKEKENIHRVNMISSENIKVMQCV